MPPTAPRSRALRRRSGGSGTRHAVLGQITCTGGLCEAFAQRSSILARAMTSGTTASTRRKTPATAGLLLPRQPFSPSVCRQSVAELSHAVVSRGRPPSACCRRRDTKRHLGPAAGGRAPRAETLAIIESGAIRTAVAPDELRPASACGGDGDPAVGRTQQRRPPGPASCHQQRSAQPPSREPKYVSLRVPAPSQRTSISSTRSSWPSFPKPHGSSTRGARSSRRRGGTAEMPSRATESPARRLQSCTPSGRPSRIPSAARSPPAKLHHSAAARRQQHSRRESRGSPNGHSQHPPRRSRAISAR